MEPQKGADLRLSCLYAAITITGANSSNLSAITKGEKEQSPKRPTTEEVLVEAKKLEKWVLGE